MTAPLPDAHARPHNARFHLLIPLHSETASSTPGTHKADAAATKGHSDNEGGSSVRPTPQTPVAALSPAAGDSTSDAIDDRQDDLMSVTSSEGRPPPRRTRMVQWRWFGAVAVLLIAGVVTWFFIDGMGTRVLVIALAFTLLLIGGASPILGAGLLRGKEERAARRRASVQLQPSQRR